MTLSECGVAALKFLEEQDVAAEMDAAVDAGEFSGPAHSRMFATELKRLADANGFSIEEIESEMYRVADVGLSDDHWVDPAGGIHSDGEEDPAAMYE